MDTQDRQPASTAATQTSAKHMAITLFAPNDDDNNPRLMRLVVSMEDGRVLAAVEDGGEDGALSSAGFPNCAPGPYFYVDAKEYERVLERWATKDTTPS
jgi:hypothetical protein